MHKCQNLGMFHKHRQAVNKISNVARDIRQYCKWYYDAGRTMMPTTQIASALAMPKMSKQHSSVTQSHVHMPVVGNTSHLKPKLQLCSIPEGAPSTQCSACPLLCSHTLLLDLTIFSMLHLPCIWSLQGERMRLRSLIPWHL